MEQQLPDILGFTDHRLFLKAVVNGDGGHRFGLRKLASKAGFNSPSTLSMVIHGKRNLSVPAAERLAKTLQLAGRRRSYFVAMSRLATARTEDEKTEMHEWILRIRSAMEETPLALAQYRCLATWFYPTIYAMVDLKSFRRDPEWIASRLGRGVTVSDVKKALGDLLNLGMLVDHEGKLVTSHAALTTGDDIKDTAVRRYHQSMLDLAKQSLDIPLTEREMNGLTFSVSSEKIPALKEKIREFRRSLNELLGGSSDKDSVYQLNIQLFPLVSAERAPEVL